MYKPRKITFLSQVTSDITCQASFFEKLYGELIPLVVKWYTPPSRSYNPLNLLTAFSKFHENNTKEGLLLISLHFKNVRHEFLKFGPYI